MLSLTCTPKASPSSGSGGQRLALSGPGCRTTEHAGRPVWLLAQPWAAGRGFCSKRTLCDSCSLPQPLLVPSPPQAACCRRDQSAQGMSCFLALPSALARSQPGLLGLRGLCTGTGLPPAGSEGLEADPSACSELDHLMSSLPVSPAAKLPI